MSFPQHPDRRPVVITGASSGIGAATARVLATRGYPVALGARRVDRLAELVQDIRDAGGEAVAFGLDVTSDESVSDFAARVNAEFGDIEVVVSNAGMTAPGTVHEISSDRFASELDLNLVGAHRIAHAFVPGMVERRRGDLVLISSDVAVRARPFMAAYATSKWGLEGMAASMQMELEGTGVRVSLVRPGPTWSEIGNEWPAEEGAKVLESWIRFGQARHGHFMQPTALAEAIHTVVAAPRGVHLSLIDVNPEAPVVEERAARHETEDKP